MTERVDYKLYLAAKKVDGLNKAGKVKGFSGNENGYAKILQIKRGCDVWIHHLKNNKLIIDLLTTPSASERYPEQVDEAVKLFKEFAGEKLEEDTFNHSINKNSFASRYFIDVTELPFAVIDDMIEDIYLKFSDKNEILFPKI